MQVHKYLTGGGRKDIFPHKCFIVIVYIVF